MSRFILTVAVVCVAGSANAGPDAARPVRARVHHLGLRFDGDGDRWAPGLGYMHAHEFKWFDRSGRSWMGWLGYGVDGVAVMPAAASVDAGMGLAVVRAGLLHKAGGVVGAAAAGAAGDRFRARGVAEAGLFISLYYLDVGYTTQLPLGPFDRPLWMPPHRLGIRLRIPLTRSD